MDAETVLLPDMNFNQPDVKPDFGKTSRDQTVNMDIVQHQDDEQLYKGKRSKSSRVNRLCFESKKGNQMRTRINSDHTDETAEFSEYAVENKRVAYY